MLKKNNQLTNSFSEFITIKQASYLPEPDLPTIPIFSFCFIENLRPFRAKGRLSLYLILYLSNMISPDLGQSAGGRLSLTMDAASVSTS